MESIKKQKTNACLTFQNVKCRVEGYVSALKLHNVDIEDFLERLESGWCFNVTDKEIVEYVSETAASMTTKHPDYGRLSSCILMNYFSENSICNFTDKIELLQRKRNIISDDMYALIMKHKDTINKMMQYENDFKFTYFALITLYKSYLLRVDDIVVERPQDLFMRTALQIHKDDFESVQITYNLISNHYFTHATPTLYNSCLKKPQLASCFLISPKEDSIEGLYDTLRQCALISKYAGGIGLNLHSIRAKGSELKSTGGQSRGIIPLLQVINSTKRHINQGGNKRSSSIAIYLEPWHKEIFEFLDLRKNHGQDDCRARDIFIGLWIPDLFMNRVHENGEWSLFCPNDAKNLAETWGAEFEKLYLKYEKTINRVVVPAQKLWKAIVGAQIETGNPYMLYKDTCNRLSNQQHLGTIKSSNLCTEIIEYCDANETAVCNLASICLPKFINEGVFDFVKLKDVSKIITYNLNNVIDSSFYPVIEAKRSNLRHRPIGIGVQGLADAFSVLRYPFESSEARLLNKQIFETMYYGALEASCEIAREKGVYETYHGSFLSKGIFHFELCNSELSGLWDWEVLRSNILKYGVNNSLFIAPMPTASTSQIFDNNEAFEPYQSNIFTRRTHAGDFQIVNKYLLKDLIKLNLWSHEMKNLLIEFEGSIQNVPRIPQEIKDLYKTAWEVKMKCVIDYAADRQAFVDQSQSLNLFIARPTYSQLTSMHFYAFRSGLKTGMYYLRTRPISSAIKFTVDTKLVEKTLSSMTDTDEVCENCSA